MILAFDPDLHSTAWCASVDGQLSGGLIHVSPRLKGDEAVVKMCSEIAQARLGFVPFSEMVALVESQELHRMHRSAPKDILRLAQVAGSILGMLGETFLSVRLVSPQVWKGQVPKDIHQARICRKLGWAFDTHAGYVVPARAHWEGFSVSKPSDWKHLMDAVGLALWGIEKKL